MKFLVLKQVEIAMHVNRQGKLSPDIVSSTWYTSNVNAHMSIEF